MFKSFQEFNDWCATHVQSELSVIVNRAVSRVTSLHRILSGVVQEYTSAYNSVQTLGYDNQGQIQDQTSADRLTVPDNVVARVKSQLSTQQSALQADKDSFITNFHPTSDLTGFAYSVASLTSINTKDVVVPLNGYGTLFIKRDSTAKLVVEKNACSCLGLTDISTVTPDNFYLAPQVLYRNDDSKYTVAIYSPKAHFPQLLPTVSDLPWRLIMVGDLSTQSQCSAILELLISNIHYTYFFTMNRVNDGSLVSNGWTNVDLYNYAFSNWSTFKQYLQNKGVSTPPNYAVFGVNYNNGALEAIGWQSMSSQMQQMANNYLTHILKQGYIGIVTTNKLSDLSGIIFDAVTDMPPDDLSDVIDTL